MKNILRKALTYAIDAHKGQTYNGHAFITHPILTNQVISIVQPDDINLQAAAYLHDILENTGISYEALVAIFGEDIANLVREVTKNDNEAFPNLKTARGAILMFADRLTNLSHIDSWNAEKQASYIDKSKFWIDET